MTQVIINVSDKSIVPGLRKILSRVEGVEKVKVVKELKSPLSKREKFLKDFRHAVAQAKEFKEGNTTFSTWEEMMNEL